MTTYKNYDIITIAQKNHLTNSRIATHREFKGRVGKNSLSYYHYLKNINLYHVVGMDPTL